MSNKTINIDKLKNLINDDSKANEILELLEKATVEAKDKSEISVSPPKNSTSCFWSYKVLGPEEKEYLSPSTKNVTGYLPEQIMSMPGGLIALVDEEGQENIKRKILNFETSGKTDDELLLEYKIKNKDGKEVWLKHALFIEITAEGIRIVKGIITDVTMYKSHLDELSAEQENLAKQNIAKDKFISIISHDLRAPFTSLLGFSEILINEHELSNEEKEEYLRYIHDASSSQLSLINYLLDWSRLQTGRINIEKKRLSIKSLVSHAKSNLTGIALRKNLNINIEVGDDAYIEADERLMIQAVSNLLSNAVKFTPENKSVTITSQPFKEGLIEIVVKDEGVGIPEKNHDKLFRLDEKFSMPGTNGEKGTGFGLTLVKEIVEKHGGDIWFYSKENEGTEFHFTAPEAKNLVLIVEDDQVIRTLYKRIIKNELNNFTYKEADNGYEALSIMANQTPSLIIADHAMPLMNGIQFIEALKDKPQHKSVPVLIVSGELNDNLREKYKAMNVKYIIDKPFDYGRLVEIVKGALEF